MQLKYAFFRWRSFTSVSGVNSSFPRRKELLRDLFVVHFLLGNSLSSDLCMDFCIITISDFLSVGDLVPFFEGGEYYGKLSLA